MDSTIAEHEPFRRAAFMLALHVGNFSQPLFLNLLSKLGWQPRLCLRSCPGVFQLSSSCFSEGLRIGSERHWMKLARHQPPPDCSLIQIFATNCMHRIRPRAQFRKQNKDGQCGHRTFRGHRRMKKKNGVERHCLFRH